MLDGEAGSSCIHLEVGSKTLCYSIASCYSILFPFLLSRAQLRWSVVPVGVVEAVVWNVLLTIHGALIPVVAGEELLVDGGHAVLGDVDDRVGEARRIVDDRLQLTLVLPADQHARIIHAIHPDLVLRHAAVRELAVLAEAVAVKDGDVPLAAVPELRLVAFHAALEAAPAVLDVHDREPELVHALAPRDLAFLHEDLGDVLHGRAELHVEAPGGRSRRGRQIATTTASSTTASVPTVRGRRGHRSGVAGGAAVAGREAENAENEQDAEQLLPVREALHGTVLPAGHVCPLWLTALVRQVACFVRVLGVP